jgi:hypothetical protein
LAKFLIDLVTAQSPGLANFGKEKKLLSSNSARMNQINGPNKMADEKMDRTLTDILQV